MKIKGVLFDKDGTLIDFQKTYGPSTASVINDLCLDNDAIRIQMAEACGFKLADNGFLPSSMVIAGSCIDMATAWAPFIGRSDIAELVKEIDQLYARHSTAHAAAFAFTSGSLARLQGMSLPLGVATNDSEFGAKSHMEKLEMTHFFQFICGSDSGYGPKPRPGMIIGFAEKLGVLPSEIAMIGDSVHDLKTAQNAGAVGIGVTTGLAGKDVLEPHADHVLESIEALPELIARLNS
ncbi:MAG: HAD family hydrolase [Salaquimonas sp.]